MGLLHVARGFRTLGPLLLVNPPSSTLGEFRIKGLQGMTAISNSETCDKRILRLVNPRTNTESPVLVYGVA